MPESAQSCAECGKGIGHLLICSQHPEAAEIAQAVMPRSVPWAESLASPPESEDAFAERVIGEARTKAGLDGEAGAVGDEAATLDGWVRWELQCLWSDFEEAQRRAVNQVWSIGCDGLAQRIRDATSLVGPVSWRNIGIAAVIDGWFAAMNARIGIENPDLPTVADIEECRLLLPDGDPLRDRGLGIEAALDAWVDP